MFNLSRFNATSFNSVGSQGIPIYSVASMHMTTSGSFKLVRSVGGTAWMHCSAIGTVVAVVYLSGSAKMQMDTDGDRIRVVFVDSEIGMVMHSSAGGYKTYGTKEIKLEDLSLSAGDEITINTDDMTVTINGQNAIARLSGDSEFFKLKPGENIISVSGGERSAADVYVIWKDRWL